MIRQPDFVTKEVFEFAKQQLLKKKPNIDFSNTKFEEIEEEYVEDMEKGHHHEIYLGDPRKTKPENLRTGIRHPIKKKKQK